MSRKRSSEERSPYLKWISSRFGGLPPKEAIARRLAAIVDESKQDSLPIDLKALAKRIGINPEPLYDEKLNFEGCLDIKDDELRVILRNRTITPRGRFTYAHELVHCLAFDLEQEPPRRIAPLPLGLEEEAICNEGARHLLLPAMLLKRYLDLEDGLTATRILKISIVAKVSIQVVAIQMLSSNVLNATENSIYMLSAFSRGYKQQSELKPRCIVSAYYSADGKKTEFLPMNKGVDGINSARSGFDSWSLIPFFKSNADCIEIKEEEFFRKKDGKKFKVSGSHQKIGGGGYVWTELRVEN